MSVSKEVTPSTFAATVAAIRDSHCVAVTRTEALSSTLRACGVPALTTSTAGIGDVVRVLGRIPDAHALVSRSDERLARELEALGVRVERSDLGAAVWSTRVP